MNNMQKMGGIASLFHAAAYVVGIVLGVTLIFPLVGADPDRYLSFLKDNQSLVYIWNLVSYWVAAASLVFMVLAIYERLKTDAPALAQVSAVFGLIWAALVIGSGNLMLSNIGVMADLYGKSPAEAKTVWLTLSAVENGIVTGNELVGSLWVALLSLAALQTRKLGKALSCLGLVTGIAGILTLIPTLAETMIMVFAPSMIAWSIWVGIALLRAKTHATVVNVSCPSLTD